MSNAVKQKGITLIAAEVRSVLPQKATASILEDLQVADPVNPDEIIDEETLPCRTNHSKA